MKRIWLCLVFLLAALTAYACGDSATGGGPTNADSGVVDNAGATCTDAKKNGAESDVDCGGTCSKCSSGQTCSTGADCSSGTCTDGKCVTPPGAPVITSFTAAKPAVSVGKATELTAVFTNGTGVVDQGVGPVTSGVPITTGNLAAGKTFTLTVTSPTGLTATQTVAVDAVTAPTITSFTAAKSTVTKGKPASLTAVFTGGTGTVNQGVGAVTTGVAKATGNLAANTTFTLTVTNAASDAVTATVEVAAVDAPVITSFVAGAPKISRGTATTVTGTFTGGTGSVDQGVGAVTTTVAAATGNLNTKTKFTLTVTNAAAEAVTATVDVDVSREIFVGTYTGNTIVVLDELAPNGVAVPKRTIAGNATTLSYPRGISVVNDEIYVANDGNSNIVVFDVMATGNVPPKRTIAGGATGLSDPTQLFVFNSEIFVGNRGGSAMSVFNFNDMGDVAPKRAVSGNLTALASPSGIAVDNGEIYVAQEGANKVNVFPIAATGNVAPTRSFNTPNSPTGLLVSGNEVFTTSTGNPTAITVFNKTTGAQLRQIAGNQTGLDYYGEQCAIVGTDILCACYGNGSLVGFPVSGNGNIAPTRTISGLTGPLGVYLY